MKIVDLFCGAGGASAGLHAAFPDAEIVGVDVAPQPRYPFRFVQADAMTYPLDGADFVWASPPCQAFTRAGHLRTAQGSVSRKPNLLTPILERFADLRVPWIVENVVGAPMDGALLCGSAFGLRVRRHRLFASNQLLLAPGCDHRRQGRPVGVYHRLNDQIPHGGRTAKTLDEAREAMGISWMLYDELKEAIPPAYSAYLARQLVPSSQPAHVGA